MEANDVPDLNETFDGGRLATAAYDIIETPMNPGRAGLDIVREYRTAKALYPGSLHSLHEGWGIIREEYLELEQEIMKRDPDMALVYKECRQTAAMCLRMMVEMHPTYRPRGRRKGDPK